MKNIYWASDADMGKGMEYTISEKEQKQYDEFCESLQDVEEDLLEIVNPETGEKLTFVLADEFDYNDKRYVVLVKQEEPEYFIGEVVEEDGESYIATLEDDDADAVYDEYERIIAEESEEA